MCKCNNCREERNQEILETRDCTVEGMFEGCVDCVNYEFCISLVVME